MEVEPVAQGAVGPAGQDTDNPTDVLWDTVPPHELEDPPPFDPRADPATDPLLTDGKHADDGVEYDVLSFVTAKTKEAVTSLEPPNMVRKEPSV